MKFLLATLIAISSTSPVIAGDYQPGYSSSKTCTRSEYKEEYIPGTGPDNPGYVKTWTNQVEVPCAPGKNTAVSQPAGDNNDCSEGTLIGGLLGTGITMGTTRGRDRWWAVPAGGVAGAMIGCQIDGG